MGNKKKINFLTYISRSGSTLLAKYLNEYKDIDMTLEARIPDNYPYFDVELKNQPQVDIYLQKLYKDDKFKTWQIARTLLMKKY